MEGFVDVRLYLKDFKGSRTVNGEAIIEKIGRTKKPKDNRYGDLIVQAEGVMDFDSLVCLAEDVDRVEEIDSKEGITFYHVPCQFNHKKYKSKDEWYYEVVVVIGEKEFKLTRHFFFNPKSEYRLLHNKFNAVFTDVETKEDDITPDDLNPEDNKEKESND